MPAVPFVPSLREQEKSMTQTLLVTDLVNLFSRFRAWIIALRENELSDEKPFRQGHDRGESKPDHDDAFYLALGLNGHW
jgi:hypothetical protein